MKKLILLLILLYSTIQAQNLNFKLNVDSTHVVYENKEHLIFSDAKIINVNIDKTLNEAEIIINSKRLVKQNFESFDFNKVGENLAITFEGGNQIVEMIFTKPSTLMKFFYIVEGNQVLYKIYYIN